MKYYVFDAEFDSLNPTKIHVLSVGFKNESGAEEIKSTSDYDQMREFFSKDEEVTLIGHNIILYDIPAMERLLGIKIKAKLIDTLAMSWYADPNRNRHGLEQYGEEFGVPKPKIDDWLNLTYEEYKYRCEEDVKINIKVWKKLISKMMLIYEDEDKVMKAIDYLMFKMKCLRMMEESKVKLDVDRAVQLLEEWTQAKEEKAQALKDAMPPDPKKSKKSKPKKMYKSDGSLSSLGKKWFDFLEEQDLPEDAEGPVEYIRSYGEPNPNSTSQLKSWLHSLGWKPETFSYNRNKETNEFSAVEQIYVEEDGQKEVCPSVKKLYEKEPALENLDGLTILKHRIGVLKGFLRDVDEDGYLRARAAGFTNTLRLRHKELVNLPKPSKPYGKDLRGLLIAEEGYKLVGSDMSSLEDRTKQHYMYKYDPEYVESMWTDDFDPHLDLAVFAGAITQEEAQAHKDKKEDHSDVRSTYKTANYACIYKTGAATLSRSTGLSKKAAGDLIKAYWDRNWAVKQVEKAAKVIEVGDEMWIYNPVSKMYYSLRYEKDKFSTLNQSTGVYCFDMWVAFILQECPKLNFQFHDEVGIFFKEGYEQFMEDVLRGAIQKVNDFLQLNVTLDIDVQFGKNYAEVH